MYGGKKTLSDRHRMWYNDYKMAKNEKFFAAPFAGSKTA